MHTETTLHSDNSTPISTIEEIKASTKYALIIEAIRERRMIKFKYQGDKQARTFSPYIIYLAKTGNLVVHGMQNVNPNDTNDFERRRTFNLALMLSAEITGASFVPTDTFDPNAPSTKYGRIASVIPWKD